MLYESFSTLFRNLYFFPLLNFPGYKVIFLFVIYYLHKLVCHLKDNIYEILRNLYYDVVKLYLNFAYECVLDKFFVHNYKSVKY